MGEAKDRGTFQERRELAQRAAPDMNDMPDVECKCGSIVFQPALRIKRISPILSKIGKEETATMNVVVCAKCGEQLLGAVLSNMK